MIKKYRHEIKYVCNDEVLNLVECKIKHMLNIDSNVDDNGEYLIRSIYFDDYRRNCFYENENGIDPREKFRIRIYNNSKDRIALEKKVKNRNMTGKESCIVDYDTYSKMINGDRMMNLIGKNDLLDEWIIARQTRLLKPVMLGEYVRKPYVYRLGNVRITFDRNIAASRDFDRMFERSIRKISVMSTGYHVLEVKYDDYLPDMIYRLIEDNHLLQSNFSKFYLGCKALEGRVGNEFY